MGRGVSAGGGQSSLGCLFGGGETTNSPPAAQNKGSDSNNAPPQKPAAPPQPDENSKYSAVGVDGSKQSQVGAHDSRTNNYVRSEGQNCGNFITDRPSTKVHAAPGGGSSLGYLFGGDGK